jgi:hypothetical protein
MAPRMISHDRIAQFTRDHASGDVMNGDSGPLDDRACTEGLGILLDEGKHTVGKIQRVV